MMPAAWTRLDLPDPSSRLSDLFDLAADWFFEHLGWLSPRLREAAVLPLVLVVSYLLARWLLVRAVPWVVRWVLRPVLAAAVGLACAALLAAQALAAVPWRAVGRRPPSIVYSVGDAVVVAVLACQGAVRAVTTRLPEALARWLGPVLPVLVAVAVWWWDRGYSGRPGSAPGGFRPSDPWVTIVRHLTESLYG